MRETKFRGKRLDTGEWVYGYYIYRYQILEDRSCHIIAHENKGKNDSGYYIVDSKTTGQFTGLKDKKGVEAYEHDLVEITWNAGLYGNESLVTGIYEIKRREDFNAVGGYGDFYLENGPSISYIKSSKIIGNTFDNPDIIIGNK